MSGQDREPARSAGAAAAAVPANTDSQGGARLPWQGKPRAADVLCWLGIVLSGVLYWALLPLRVSLLGTHPVVAELLNGSTESIISAAAFARTGQGTIALVLLAAIPGLMKFDPFYWWAGRLWGERFLMTLPGGERMARRLARVQGANRKFTWPAVIVSCFLPVPRAVVFVIAGWAGMRLVTFLLLDLVGILLWSSLLAGLGYSLGHEAVVAAKTISHYGWWVTIAIMALSAYAMLRSGRRLAATAAVPASESAPANM